MKVLDLIREIRSRKTLTRILLNTKIKELAICLEGRVYDLGSAGGNSSYYRFMRKGKVRISTVDIDPNSKAEVITDLNKSFPFRSGLADIILAFNVVQYLENPKLFFYEGSRVLKSQGVMYCNFPFVSPIQDHPTDLYRYTPSSIKLLVKDSGFNVVGLIPYGGRFSGVVSLFDHNLSLVVKPFLYIGALLLDYFDRESKECPLGYLTILSNKKQTKD